MYPTNPRNCRTLFRQSGIGHDFTSSILFGSHSRPRLPTIWPRKGTDARNKWHLLDFSCKPYERNLSNINVKLDNAALKVPPKEDDIIKVDQATIPPETLEHPIHQPLEGRRSITQTKRHHSKLEQPGMCRKCRLSPGIFR